LDSVWVGAGKAYLPRWCCFFAADTLVMGVTSTIQSGLDFALLMATAAFSFPFGIIPPCGLFYLICWAWEKICKGKILSV